MTIQTYTASTMADALAEVKRNLGQHAVVLHTRSYKRGGLLGLGAKTVIEVTAADGRELGRQRGREAAKSPRAQALRQASRQRPAVDTTRTPDPQQLAGDLIRRTYQAARSQFDEPVNVASPAATAVLPEPTLAPAPSAADPQLSRELQAVRQLVEQVVRQQQSARTLATAPPTAGLPDALVEHYATLIENEIEAELASQIVRGVDTDAGGDVSEALVSQIAKLLPARDAEAPANRVDGRPLTIALVGPTGVGKTTTVAKLAATYKLKQNKKVGLITADTYRIAAVEQLRTYAQIIGLPLEIVSGENELATAIGRMADMDVILIDTAGRSQRNFDRLGELSRLLEVAQPHETHLVLSATASQRVLLEIVDRFAAVNPDHLIFTKLDEAVTCGGLLNVARQVNRPLSYLTTGQEVPHQIEPCDPKRLASLMLGREAVLS